MLTSTTFQSIADEEFYDRQRRFQEFLMADVRNDQKR